MRRVLLLLIIALLPLRAWVGDGMALAALTPEQHSAAVAADLPPCHAAMASSDMAHAPHGAQASQDDTTHDGAHAHCSSCDICHGSVLGAASPLDGMAPAPRPQPSAVTADFASALPHGAFKPPIA